MVPRLMEALLAPEPQEENFQDWLRRAKQAASIVPANEILGEYFLDGRAWAWPESLKEMANKKMKFALGALGIKPELMMTTDDDYTIRVSQAEDKNGMTAEIWDNRPYKKRRAKTGLLERWGGYRATNENRPKWDDKRQGFVWEKAPFKPFEVRVLRFGRSEELMMALLGGLGNEKRA